MPSTSHLAVGYVISVVFTKVVCLLFQPKMTINHKVVRCRYIYLRLFYIMYEWYIHQKPNWTICFTSYEHESYISFPQPKNRIRRLPYSPHRLCPLPKPVNIHILYDFKSVLLLMPDGENVFRTCEPVEWATIFVVRWYRNVECWYSESTFFRLKWKYNFAIEQAQYILWTNFLTAFVYIAFAYEMEVFSFFFLFDKRLWLEIPLNMWIRSENVFILFA